MNEQTEENNEPAPKHKRSGWWTLLKVVLILLFLVLALVGGTYAGYVVLGKQDPGDMLKWETWRHVYDLVFAP